LLLSPIALAQTAPEAKNVVPNTAGVAMNTPTHDKSISALLVVDPYNDFISEGGKIWPPAILVRAAVMATGQLGLSVGRQAQGRDRAAHQPYASHRAPL
jgi:hypothetical protein